MRKVTKAEHNAAMTTIRLLMETGNGELADQVTDAINVARVATVKAPDYEPEWDD